MRKTKYKSETETERERELKPKTELMQRDIGIVLGSLVSFLSSLRPFSYSIYTQRDIGTSSLTEQEYNV